MSLIVQKYGGSSVADAEKLLHISHIVKASYDAGNDVIVVVSAQGDVTDRLIEKAKEIAAQPSARELDALLACGEQASAALTALALEALAVPAVSLNAWQIPLRTDGVHADAKIETVGRERVTAELRRRRVAVVAGFQGVDAANDVNTLGRGGSDYTAVALAAEFGADECRIYTDVDGVYTADPRLCPTARRLPAVSYEDMYALSRAGAQVLHDKCVALAQSRGVEPLVLSCAANAAGTRVTAKSAGHGVTGVTRRVGEGEAYATVTLVGGALPSLALEKEAFLALNAAEIAIHGLDAAERSLTLYVERERSREALCALHDALIR